MVKQLFENVKVTPLKDRTDGLLAMASVEIAGTGIKINDIKLRKGKEGRDPYFVSLASRPKIDKATGLQKTWKNSNGEERPDFNQIVEATDTTKDALLAAILAKYNAVLESERAKIAG